MSKFILLLLLFSDYYLKMIYSDLFWYAFNIYGRIFQLRFFLLHTYTSLIALSHIFSQVVFQKHNSLLVIKPISRY